MKYKKNKIDRNVSSLPIKKKSHYNIFFEFKTSFQNANSKGKLFFYCRSSKLLEQVLVVLWDLHCIAGYLKQFDGHSHFFKVIFKKDFCGQNIVNQLICYPSTTFISWIELKKIVSKENSTIYLVITSVGLVDGQTAIKYGLGGCLVYKVIL